MFFGTPGILAIIDNEINLQLPTLKEKNMPTKVKGLNRGAELKFHSYN